MAWRSFGLSGQIVCAKRSALKKNLIIAIGFILGVVVFVVVSNPFLLMFLGGDYESARTKTPLNSAHERAVNTFVESESFGIERFRKADLWNDLTVSHQGEVFRPKEIRLIGVTPEYGQRLFTEGRPPLKEEISVAPFRPLNKQEILAIQNLNSMETEFEELPLDSDERVKSIRVLLPIFARRDCISCHSVEVGDMLGAFDYVLTSEKPMPDEQVVPPKSDRAGG